MTKAEKARSIVEQFPTLSKKELGRRLKHKYPHDFKESLPMSKLITYYVI